MQRFFPCNCQIKKSCMKNLLIAAIICLIVFACSKTNSSNPITVSNLSGKWELREVIGGLAGDIKYNSGNGNITQFNSDYTFKIINLSTANGLTGKFEIIKINSSTTSLLHLKFDSTSYNDATDSLKIENNLLILTTPQNCCDIPYFASYEKLQ